MDQKAQPKHTLEEIFELSMAFLANPWIIWKNGDLTLKKTVLRLVFDKPLAYSKKTGFRTPQTSVIFRFLDDLTEKCKMVPGGGIEPPTRGFSIHCSTPELPGQHASTFYCCLSVLGGWQGCVQPIF